MTAGKIGSYLDQDAVSLWVAQRHLVDYLILVDWETETTPLPNPLQALTHAITKVSLLYMLISCLQGIINNMVGHNRVGKSGAE